MESAHYFHVSNWRRDRQYSWSSEPRKGLAVFVRLRTKEGPIFFSFFRPRVCGLAPGIVPANSRSAVKRFTE